MEVVVAGDLSVRVEHPDDLRRFRTRVALPVDRLDDLRRAFDGIGEVESDQVVWISAAWLQDNSGCGGNEEWREAFGRMQDFAAKHGWVRGSDHPMIRSHIEWEPAHARSST